ncbi:hypothetical protein KAH37_01965 [bacterium]|nr:hypothetical protein [bacterium]
MRILLFALLASTLFLSSCSSCSRDTATREDTKMPATMEVLQSPQKLKVKPLNLRIKKPMNTSFLKKMVQRKREKEAAVQDSSQEKPDTENKK